MTRTQSRLLVAFAGIIALSVGFLCWRLCLTADAITAQVGKTGPVLDGAAQALKTINTPKSGTLSMLDDTILQGRLTIDATNEVLLHEQRQLTTIDRYAAHLDSAVVSISAHTDRALDGVSTAASSLTETATAASTALTAATGAIGTAQTTIAAFQPVLVGATEAENSLNDLLKRKAVGELLDNLAAGTATGDAILTDVHVASHPFLNPDPCKNKRCKFGRYVWPVIKTGLGLGSEVSGWERAAGKPLNVKTQ
jgi:hypothetical protein